MKVVSKLFKKYEEMNYKALMVLPIVLLLFSISFLMIQWTKTGSWFEKGIDLKGGSLLSIQVKRDVDSFELERFLKGEGLDVSVKTVSGLQGKGVLIQAAPEITEEEILQAVRNYGTKVESSSFQQVSPKLSESFFKQSRLALIIAFIFMGIVVLFVFKTHIPSIAVVLAAFSDIICTLAFSQILGFKLTLASFAGLLLVLGYSIDTDILLTTRVIKRRKGTIVERSIEAMKTGLTMTTTTLGALVVLFFASTSPVLKEIASILIIALIIDVVNTWGMNLSILRWWKE